MKKFIITFVLALAVLFGLYACRDRIIDQLPIDQSGWSQNEYGTIYLDQKGDPVSGWLDVGGARYYFRPDTFTPHTGWLELPEGRYYLDAQGRPVSGWTEIQGIRHYFQENGKPYTGLLLQDGLRYWMDESGVPAEGLMRLPQGLRYISADGRIRSGWVEYRDSRCFLDEDAAPVTGWLEEDGARYYLDEALFTPVTGWLELPEGRFYLKEDGAMATGWTEIGGEIYNFDNAGAPLAGWAEKDGQKRYFGPDGTVLTGWLEDSGKKYYLKADGSPAVGKLEIDGKNYFFTSTGENFIFVNPWNSLPEDFQVDLVQVPGAWVDPVCQEALERMLADCRAAGFRPQIVSSYRSIIDQRVSLENMIKTYTQSGYSYAQAYATATQIVAVPGTSEHHLGLALDIVDSSYPKLNHQQATMPTQQWLMEHCWEYGFIMRYPEGTTDITGIIYEPWHYRYVGLELAKEIHDLGNITLEEYIDNLTNDGSTCGGQTAE